MAPAIAVIGCGNPLRGDDGVGPHVVRLLAARPCGADPRVRLLDAGTDGMAVMAVARTCRALVVVDARRPAGTPGALYEVPGAELEQPHAPSLTLHDFRWDHALYAARRMAAAAPDVVVLLVEAQSLELGAALTPAVAAAAARAAARIEALVAARLQGLEAAA